MAKDRVYCKAANRRGEHNTHWAMHGQEVCHMHGGKSPQALKRAEERLAQRVVNKAMVTFGLPVDVEPGEALLEEVRRTAGHVRWLEAMVHDLQPEALVWNRTEATSFKGTERGQLSEYASVAQGAQPSVWLTLYQAERGHLLKVCAAAIAAGISEREVRLREQWGAILAQVMRETVADPELDLDEHQREVALRVVSRHLSAVPAA